MAAWRSKGGRSANAAKERLKLVLIHDRTDLTPKAVDQMKNELDGSDLPLYCH